MDDEQIEEMLRESWNAQPPPGMRERVLGRAGAEAPAPRARWGAGVRPRWQHALAGVGLLAVTLAAATDHARCTRLGTGSARPAVAVPAEDILRQRAEHRRLLAWARGQEIEEEGSL